MALTNTAIKNIKPKNKPFKKADAKGLYLIVTPQGGKRWRFKYRYQYKEKCLSLGLYPDVSLSMARKRRDEQRRLLAEGIDPGAKRITEKSAQIEKNANSFEVVAREWLEKKKVGWSDEGRKVTSLFEKNIFPWIGNKAIADLTVPELLKVLRRIEDRGALETVRKSLSYCSQIFRYGVSTGRLSNDPTINLRGAFKPPKSTHFAAVTGPEELGQILRSFDGYQGKLSVRCALRLTPLLFVRPGELRKAQWKDINLERQEWRYLVSKTTTEHIVPCSKQAINIFEEIKPLTGDGTYVFPSDRSLSRPMSDNALLSAMRRMGIGKDETSIHGFRATARTILDEVLGFRPDYIEHQLAHSVRDPLGRAYNRTHHLDERRKMMQKWADYLDELKAKKH